MRIMFIIIIILVAAAVFIIHEQQTDFKNIKSVYEFGKTYFRWMGMVVSNIRNVAESASNMRWVPKT